MFLRSTPFQMRRNSTACSELYFGGDAGKGSFCKPPMDEMGKYPPTLEKSCLPALARHECAGKWTSCRWKFHGIFFKTVYIEKGVDGIVRHRSVPSLGG